MTQTAAAKPKAQADSHAAAPLRHRDMFSHNTRSAIWNSSSRPDNKNVTIKIWSLAQFGYVAEHIKRARSSAAPQYVPLHRRLGETTRSAKSVVPCNIDEELGAAQSDDGHGAVWNNSTK